MRDFMESDPETFRRVQVETWRDQVDEVADALDDVVADLPEEQRRAWEPTTGLAVAARIRNSVGSGGFATLGTQSGWDMAVMLRDYPSFRRTEDSDHREDRVEVLRRQFGATVAPPEPEPEREDAAE